jgi:HTH-type transcriptional regulator/antitoxin HigA
MTIKPIKNKKDYQSALKLIRSHWNAQPNTPEGDALDVLITLVEAYEEKHCTIDPPDPVEAIKFRMEQKGLSRGDVAPLLGGKSRVSEVFAHKKPLTLKMIKNLHQKIGVPYESLIDAT